VLDGQEGPLFDRIGEGSLFFSPDGHRFCYVARRQAREYMIVDGKESAPLEGVVSDSIRFSPDSEHLAYGVSHAGRYSVVIDDKALRPFDNVLGTSVVFSPDSRFVAYLAREGSSARIVVHETPSAQRYVTIMRGSQITFDGARAFHVLAIGEKEFVRVDAAIELAP